MFTMFSILVCQHANICYYTTLEVLGNEPNKLYQLFFVFFTVLSFQTNEYMNHIHNNSFNNCVQTQLRFNDK